MHFGVCVATRLFQREGAALPRNDPASECFLFVLSPNPEMFSLHWEEEVAVSVHLSVKLDSVFVHEVLL